MILPEYKKLFEPYTTDGASLEGSINWLIKTCKIDQEVADLIIGETMMEILRGKDFAGPCECGCDLTNAHTKIEHYMRDKAYQFSAELKKAIADKFEQREQTRILSHIKADNEAYTREKLTPKWYHKTWKFLNTPISELF